MKKTLRKTSILLVVFNLIMLLNTVLEVKATLNDTLGWIEVEDGIQDIITSKDKIVIVNKSGKSKVIKENEEILLRGKNYKKISNNLIINDENLIFNLDTETYENIEVSNSYIEFYNSIKEKYDFEYLYILENKATLINRTSNGFKINYYILSEEAVDESVNSFECDSIDFTSDGELYFRSNESVSEYIDGKNKFIINVPTKYSFRCYYGNKLIIFNDDRYLIVDTNSDVLENENGDINNVDNNIYDNNDVDNNIKEEVMENENENIISTDENSINNYEDKINENSNFLGVKYQTHIQDIGWQDYKTNGQVAGTESESKRLEAIKIQVNGLPNGITISYRTHIQDIGWQAWKNNGELSGTEGLSKRLEAIEIKLSENDNYRVEYRVHVQDYGWQDWKSNGELAGTVGEAKRIEAIQIRIVEQITNADIKYQTHIQDYGWQDYKTNGQVAGTEGQSKRLEAIRINIDGTNKENLLTYRTHVQQEGWQEWVSEGDISGTEGKGYRLEAIQIKLNDEIPGYKLYYRVHIQDYGWQEWKSSGEIAGTVGQSKRLEAIEIKLVKNKNKTIVIDAGHNYGGDDGAYATHNGIRYCERDLNMSISIKLKRALELYGFNIIMTREIDDKETISMKESLSKRVSIANNANADLFISIHQNSYSNSSVNGVEVFYSSNIPSRAIRGSLINRKYSLNEKITKSKSIGESIVNSIATKMNRNNRGLKDSNYYVVKNTNMPSILIECGFISNPSEAKKLASDDLQKTMTNIIADEVNKQF